MKKLNLILFLMLAFSLIMSVESCKDKDDDTTNSDEDVDTEITDNTTETTDNITILEKPSNTIIQGGGQTHIKFTTTAGWTIVPSIAGADWISVSPTSGSKGENLVTIIIKENPYYEERNCGFTIKCGNATVSMTLAQKQKDAILVSSDKIEINCQAQTVEVEVQANVDYVDIIESSCNWIKPAVSKELTKTVLKYQVEQNNSSEVRSAKIAFKASKEAVAVLEEVIIYQTGTSQTLFILSDKNITMGQKGGSIKVEIQSNNDINTLMDNVLWLNIDDTKPTSSFTRYYAIAENKEREARNAKIIFSTINASIRDTVFITQEAFVDELTVTSNKDITINNAGGDFEVKVNCNTNYTIEMPEWISGDNQGSEGINTHTFSAKINDKYEDLVGEIVITNELKNITEKINVTQLKRVDGLSIISYPSEPFDYTGGTGTVQLSSNNRWTATIEEGCRSWILIDPSSSEDVKEFQVTVRENSTLTKRSGEITVSSGNLTEKFTIKQNGIAPMVEVVGGINSLHLPYTGGQVDIKINANCQYSITFPEWLSGDSEGVAGTTIHSYQAASISSTSDKTGNIIIKSDPEGVELIIPITQDGRGDVLEITNTLDKPISAEGGDHLIKFDVNGNWTCSVSSNASSWMFLNPTDGGNELMKDLAVTCSRNDELDSRTGIVTIQCGTVTRTVEIQQNGLTPYINATITNQTNDPFKYQGGTLDVQIESNIDYTMTLPSWISGDQSGKRGTNNHTFKIAKNESDSKRDFTIVFINETYNVSQSVTVTQEYLVDKVQDIEVLPATISSNTNSGTISFYSYDAWTAEVTSSTPWLTLEKNSGSGGEKEIQFYLTENTTFAPRKGTIAITCAACTKTVEIVQEGLSPVLNITSDKSPEYNFKSQTFVATIESNINYTISLPTWITGETSGEAGINTHTFTLLENTAYEDRSDVITFSNNLFSLSDKITVTQKAVEDDITIISEPKDVIFAVGGDESQIVMTVTNNWTLESPEWCETDLTSGDKGTYTIKLTIQPNNTGVARFASIIIRCGTVSKSIELFQSSK